MGDVKQISTLPRTFATTSTAHATTSGSVGHGSGASSSGNGLPAPVIDFELNVPPNHPAPKAATLSHRKSASNEFAVDDDANPLRILRDKHFPIVRPKLKNLAQSQDDVCGVGNVGGESADKDSMCESPSYLLNPEYTFNEKDINLQSYTPKEIAHKDIDATLNPIPLPPRDRNKVVLANPKRHVRKHPLIIPGSILQRTLNKVIQTTPTEEKTISFEEAAAQSSQPLTTVHLSSSHHQPQQQQTANNSTNSSSSFDTHSRRSLNVAKFPEIDHCYVNQDDVNVSSTLDDSKNYTKEFIENNFLSTPTSSNRSMPNISERTYENLEMFNCSSNHDNTDSASLHFESILECDINAVNDVSHDLVDGFDVDFDRGCFASPQSSPAKENFNDKAMKHVTDELKLEYKRQKFLQKYPKYATPQNELAEHALFNKVKETVEQAQSPSPAPSSSSSYHHQQEQKSESLADSSVNADGGELKKSINYVSCEDLLEFADKKPKGRERGLESDEVRIMSKVLGTEVLPEKCLLTLDFIDWDVHKAIKICKLQNILSSLNLTLEQCVETLQKYDWDLHTTALKLRAHK